MSKSAKETEKIGEKFAKHLKPGDVVCLYGDLGYGKTTFVKGVAKGLGLTARITSPTFTIIRTYNNMHHVDLYRIEDETQLAEIGIKEILEDPSSIKLIEWPEKMAELPRQRWSIVFEMNKDSDRTIKIDKHE